MVVLAELSAEKTLSLSSGEIDARSVRGIECSAGLTVPAKDLFADASSHSVVSTKADVRNVDVDKCSVSNVLSLGSG